MEFLIILGPLALIAGLLLWLARRADRLYEESAHWPKVDARITESRISRNSKGGRWPAIKYEYLFQGQLHKGSRLTFVQQNLTAAQCDEVLATYPTGKMVKAHVDSTNPSYAILERKAGGGRALRIAVATIGAIFIFVILVLVFSK